MSSCQRHSRFCDIDLRINKLAGPVLLKHCLPSHTVMLLLLELLQMDWHLQ